MKIIWPDKFKIRAEKIGKNKWKINYIERVEDAPKGAFENAAKMLRNVSETFSGGKWKVRLLKGGISISMEGNREEIYDFIVSEFLPQSAFGKMTLGEIFTRMGVMLGTTKPNPDVLKQLKQMGIDLVDLPQPGITRE
ncbi:unnamed protein product, partial [marine sediment metagenome]